MAFRLVIAEKPSVAQTIAAALGIKGKQDGYIEGGGYLISWCVGHLVQLAEAAAYGEQYKPKNNRNNLIKRARRTDAEPIICSLKYCCYRLFFDFNLCP